MSDTIERDSKSLWWQPSVVSQSLQGRYSSGSIAKPAHSCPTLLCMPSVSHVTQSVRPASIAAGFTSSRAAWKSDSTSALSWTCPDLFDAVATAVDLSAMS
jgi:hypothetical protein